MVDLLEERVVELDSQVGRPSDCLSDKTCEHQFPEKRVATHAAKHHEAKCVGAQGLDERYEAKTQHEASRMPVWHASEGYGLVFECRHNDLDVGR